MDFKTICIIKHPIDKVWHTMRDHFPDIGELINEIEKIEKENAASTEGGIKTIHIWTARPDLPAMLQQYIKPEMLSWTDTALWEDNTHICQWNITSHYFKNNMQCAGKTTFEPAIGGKGTRLTFEGQLMWAKAIPGFDLMNNMVAKLAEPVIQQVITQNFRKVAEATEGYIGMLG